MSTVIVNRMFTGSYLSEGKNIGHETFMLFRPDKKDGKEQPYQIYLMSNGDYPVSRINDIPSCILLVRGIDSKTLEVTAKATGIKPVFIPKGKWVSYFDAPETHYLGREMLKKEKCEQWWNALPERKKDNALEKMGLAEAEIKELFSTYIDNLSFQENKKSIESNICVWEKNAKLLYDLADLMAVNDLRSKSPKDGGCDFKLSKAVRMRAIHIEQLCYIIKNDIRYADVRMDEYYEHNSESINGTSIFVTYTADKLVKPKSKIILSIDKAAKGEGIYKIASRERLSGSRSATYFEDKDLVEVLNECNWGEDFGEIEKKKIKQLSEKSTFLTISGKEYDELAYSNTFAYFFKKEQGFLKYFLEKLFKISLESAQEYTLSINEVGGGIKEVTETNIAREHKNIDLLIEYGKNVFVIENKIKSAINGAEHDIHGKTIKNQLDKYYKYIEDKYDEGYTKFYALFIPNYNKTYCPTDASEAQKKFFDNLKYYGRIAKITKEYFEEKYKDKPLSRESVYFEDFVKALEKHSKNIDNDFEELSLLRIKDFIN